MSLLEESIPGADSLDACRNIVEALDSLRIAVAVFDKDDRLTYCNAHFRFIFRSFRMMEDLIGSNFDDLLRRKLANGELAGQQVLADPEGYIWRRMEQRRKTTGPLEERLSDGRWIRICERPLKDGGTIAVYTDITETKQDEYRLLGAIESGGDALAFWDQRDCLVLRNTAFVELLCLPDNDVPPGVDFQSVLENAARAHFHTGDEDAATWFAERLRRHRLPHHQELWRHRDGRWFMIDENRTRDGGVVTRVSDVTAIKENELAMIERGTTLAGAVHQLEMSKHIFERQAAEHVETLEDLSQAKAEIEKASLSKTRFLSIMSHELRTPMNAIIGFSEILQSEMLGPLGTKKYAEYAGDIFTSAKHLLALINDLLDMSKVDAGKWRINSSDVEICDFVRSCCRLIAEQAANHSLTMDITLPKDPTRAFFDERAMRQVLLNLLSNAIKFTKPDGHIVVGVEIDEAALTIVVSDNGVGIPEGDLERVFRAFEQGENSLDRAHEGTGLGLALCKSLIELHNGTIVLESEEGKGTTVTLRLPQNGELNAPEPTFDSADLGDD